MFGLSGLGMKIAIAAILFSVISGGYFYIQSLQSELKLAAEVQGKMKDVIDTQNQAMDNIKKDVERINQGQREIATKVQEAEKSRNDLVKKFTQDAEGNERNISKMAEQKPSEMEIKINRATKNALRCNEIITGSPLTEEEKTGKLKNTVCPELFPKVGETK